MAFSANGPSGEVLVGGRTAVRLGRWNMKSMGAGAFIIEAAVAHTDDYLIQMPTPRVLKLVSGNKYWVWKGVTLSVSGSEATITGSGKMKVIPRE